MHFLYIKFEDFVQVNEVINEIEQFQQQNHIAQVIKKKKHKVFQIRLYNIHKNRGFFYYN